MTGDIRWISPFHPRMTSLQVTKTIYYTNSSQKNYSSPSNRGKKKMPTQTRQTDLTNPIQDEVDKLTSTTSSSSDSSSSAADAAASGTEHPSKVTGQYHSMKGSVVETIGNTAGWEEWKESGRREHEQGQRELEDAEQLFPIE
ncbi:hypothetical protein P170DRAFT_465096 [Aspergillus steynii IBT 23096]|uniref:Uncharacterized protein n=1 Tax=Aspergillus steynii IBT 23096 TaxID=1392250 RepID=A0A2I2GA92_9EURO|nr:uncharacterized protein P170DRAFT_465096 [Aspergillus steynii IBT 23096]PLB49783.1 hypothetical protein P170DRAFT_465096 [Aspergillus steynii IBT 23096]